MKQKIFCLLLFCAACLFSQDEKLAPGDLIGKIVRITGQVEGYGIVLAYEENGFIQLVSSDGSESRSIMLTGLRYAITIEDADREEYQKLKQDGILNEDGALKVENIMAANPIATWPAPSEPPAAAKEPSPPPPPATEDWIALIFAQAKNTRKAYENVIREYPNSQGAAAAQRILDDPAYAFFKTCPYGNDATFKAFGKLHPTSALVKAAEAYRAFHRKAVTPVFAGVSNGKNTYTDTFRIADIRNFIAQNPENPFGPAALDLVPAGWLKNVKSRLGVRITITGPLYKKGLLVKGSSKPEKMRQILWKKVSKDLKENGVVPTLIGEADAERSAIDFTHLLEIEYSEQKPGETSSPNYSSGGTVAEQWNEAAAKNLTDGILTGLFNSPQVSLAMSIQGVSDKKILFRNFQNVTLMHHANDAAAYVNQGATPGARLARMALALITGTFPGGEPEALRLIAEYLNTPTP